VYGLLLSVLRKLSILWLQAVVVVQTLPALYRAVVVALVDSALLQV
jgi:hypothetical protein